MINTIGRFGLGWRSPRLLRSLAGALPYLQEVQVCGGIAQEGSGFHIFCRLSPASFLGQGPSSCSALFPVPAATLSYSGFFPLRAAFLRYLVLRHHPSSLKGEGVGSNPAADRLSTD